jgi:hypothetical protein
MNYLISDFINECSKNAYIGTVKLTKPTELKGGQSAISRSGGTLLFAHPERNMTDTLWKDFFNSLEIVK